MFGKKTFEEGYALGLAHGRLQMIHATTHNLERDLQVARQAQAELDDAYHSKIAELQFDPESAEWSDPKAIKRAVKKQRKEWERERKHPSV